MAKAEQKIRLGLLNVQSGIGTTKGYYQYLLHLRKYARPHDSDRIISLGELVRQEGIDVLATVEIDQGSRRTRGVDQVELLAEKSGLKYNSFFPTLVLSNRVNQGNAVHSRFLLSQSRKYFLPGAGEPRTAGSVLVELDGKQFTFFVTHLSLKAPFRPAQIRELSHYINETKTPVILAGDFNIRHEGELEILESSKLQKVYSGKTYPVWRPRRRLDYIFTDSNIRISQGRVLRPPISDHALLLVDIFL